MPHSAIEVNTVAGALAEARRKIGATDARVLLCHVLGCSATWIVAHDGEAIDPQRLSQFHALVDRRSNGEPIAYLTGFREFYGRDFAVAPGVLIPRPETELLIDIPRSKLDTQMSLRILDLGTGSGCIALTLSLELPAAEVVATDISEEALSVARKNAGRLGVGDRVKLIRSDWFSALDDERFDLIVSNPPYIAAADDHLSQGDLRFEPLGALASGADGLDAIRCIVENADSHLRPGGLILIEHGYDQAERVATLLKTSGLCSIEQYRDIAGVLRVSGAQLPAKT